MLSQGPGLQKEAYREMDTEDDDAETWEGMTQDEETDLEGTMTELEGERQAAEAGEEFDVERIIADESDEMEAEEEDVHHDMEGVTEDMTSTPTVRLHLTWSTPLAEHIIDLWSSACIP